MKIEVDADELYELIDSLSCAASGLEYYAAKCGDLERGMQEDIYDYRSTVRHFIKLMDDKT